MMVLMFLALVLPNPQEGIPSFEHPPPFATFGKMFLNHLNTFDHTVALLSLLPCSVMDLALLTLGAIHFYGKSTGSKIDTAGQVKTPKAMVKLAHCRWPASRSCGWSGSPPEAASAFLLAAERGHVSTAHVPVVSSGPAWAGGPQAAGQGATRCRGVQMGLAFYVMNYITGGVDEYSGIAQKLPYATAHADSLLFADACLVLIALLLERVKIKAWAAFLLPLFAIGMISNNRRLVWVQVIAVLLTVFIVSKDNPVKRFIRRFLVVAAPIVAIYVLAGWNSMAGMTFKPVRILRSVVDAKSDGSSFWRELENFNLIVTLRNNPILGTGYGHPYPEYVAMPAVDYPLNITSRTTVF